MKKSAFVKTPRPSLGTFEIVLEEEKFFDVNSLPDQYTELKEFESLHSQVVTVVGLNAGNLVVTLNSPITPKVMIYDGRKWQIESFTKINPENFEVIC